MKKTYFLQLLIVIAGLILTGCGRKRSPENLLNDFLTQETMESFLALPLCAGGEKIVPLVTEKVRDRNMKRRRYAIGFLGVTESRLPIPVLEKIVKDETEEEVFRGDALHSIYLLDESLGKKLANENRDRMDYPGETAREILQVKDHSIYRKKQKEQTCNPDT
jgi:hypothetical protein